MTELSLVHDYLTQRGGAERVVLALSSAFPDAPIYTSLYDPAGTFSEFTDLDVRALSTNRLPFLRRRHRLALPLLAPAFSHLKLDSDVTLCSSSGWAHGARTTGRKIVYCHAPARWLYQPQRYSGRKLGSRVVLGLLGPPLRHWDHRAVATADRYLVNSRAVRAQVAEIYGIDAEVLPPPASLLVSGAVRDVQNLSPGFILCVSRLLPYKNVDRVVDAFAKLPAERLVVAGTGPCAARLGSIAGRNVKLLGEVDDGALRWLYSECRGLVAASYEDFGLTPLEAAVHGKPSAVLRWGGFLDTIREGKTGVFFDEPEPAKIADAVRELLKIQWDQALITEHAESFSTERFVSRVRAVVAEELALVR